MIDRIDSEVELNMGGVIATLRLNRPSRKHALSQRMWEALAACLSAVEANPTVKVLILTSSSADAFCAGADIEEFGQYAEDADWRARNQAAIARVQIQLARLRQPTIARISGVCVGGGCGLAIACDLRIATTSARFGITPAKLGLVYSLHDTKLLVDLVGPSRAKSILFTGRLLEADEALRIGLIDQLCAPDQLDTLVADMAAQIATVSQHSVRSSKQMIRRILDGAADDDAASSAMFNDAFMGIDFQEGVAAFLAKRKPVFPMA